MMKPTERGNNMSQKKHLALDDRKVIESMLNENYSFTKIGKSIGKAISTISREVKSHRIERNQTPYGRIPNRCKQSHTCLKRNICAVCIKKDCQLCRTCGFCNQYCSDFEEEICSKLNTAPFVCNGCQRIRSCSLRKLFYRADKAQKEYEFLLSDARSGYNATEATIKRLNEIMTEPIKQGQSINHVLMSNPDTIPYSARTIYTYVRAGLLRFKNWDLPRVIRMKPRKAKSTHLKVDKKCRINRTWTDYLIFKDEVGDFPPVEIDSVIGTCGGKVLLTIMFTNCNFMLAFLRDHNDSQSVIDSFDHLFRLLGFQLFTELFPVIIADNGTEFSNPAAIEFAPDGSRRSHLFYCDPQAPFQKPRVEENHTLIRRILPKGTSFDSLSQSDIDLVMSHVNSYKRASLNGKSPIELFSFIYGEQVLSLFPYKLIPPEEIRLSPSLLK